MLYNDAFIMREYHRRTQTILPLPVNRLMAPLLCMDITGKPNSLSIACEPSTGTFIMHGYHWGTQTVFPLPVNRQMVP